MSTKIEQSMDELLEESNEMVSLLGEGLCVHGERIDLPSKTFVRLNGLEITNDEGCVSIVGEIKSLEINGEKVDVC